MLLADVAQVHTLTMRGELAYVGRSTQSEVGQVIEAFESLVPSREFGASMIVMDDRFPLPVLM
jgi:hypothetical protein